MALILTALIMLLILGYQVPSLVVYKKWWDLTVFLAFWAGATLYALLTAARAGIPTSTEIITSVLDVSRQLLGK